jgi:hypothetical protein
MAKRKARFLLPLVLLFVIPITAQVEHALTPEQCRADADVWGVPKATAQTLNDYEFRNLTGDTAHSPTITAKKLNARIDELSMCMRTDPTQSFRYEEGSRAFNIAILLRLGEFVSRHQLMNQFYQEDDKGQR